jgi:MFS family permease
MNWKSFWAVVAGLLFTILITTLVDIALYSADVFAHGEVPLTDRLALLATSYRIVISIFGAWLTARLAPQRPMKHALILGAVGMVLGLAGVIGTWNLNMGPHWYPIALAVLAFPQCWLGGWLYEMTSGRREAPV